MKSRNDAGSKNNSTRKGVYMSTVLFSHTEALLATTYIKVALDCNDTVYYSLS